MTGIFSLEGRMAMVTGDGRGLWPDSITVNAVAGAVVFLAAPQASCVTGHTLVVDGGYITHF